MREHLYPLAHGGGAPEAAAVVVPLILVGVFVAIERRNAGRRREAEQRESDGPAVDDG